MLFFHYQLETNNFAEEKYLIPIIPFLSILLNLLCLRVSLGVQEKLDIGNVQYSLVRTLISFKLSDNKDIE